MRRIFGIVLLCAVVVAVAWWVAGLPGQIAAEVSGISVQTSVPVAAVLLLVLFGVLYAVIRLINALMGMPANIRWSRARRARRQGDLAVTRALVALAAGEPADARREAQRSRRFLGDTAQTLLLAAEAGRQAKREDEAETAFRALADREDAAFLGLRGLLAQAVAREDWPAAAEFARRAEAAHPGASWLRQERLQLAIRTHAWPDALALTPADGTPGDGAMKAALATAAANAEPDAEASLNYAKQAFAADPALAPAALAYATRLRTSGREKRAQAVVAQAWTAQPHPELASFALAPVSNPIARHQAAQKLASTRPGDAESSLLLGRTALSAGLFGEARRHADTARQAVNQRRAWMLLADIAEAEHDPEAGRQALRNAATAGADPAWRCAACGTLHGHWLAVCPVCSTAGRVGWTVQPGPVLLAQRDDEAEASMALAEAPGPSGVMVEPTTVSGSA